MFRKETRTNQYLKVGSNHPLEYMRGVVYTLLYQVEAIVSNPKYGKRRRLTSGKH